MCRYQNRTTSFAIDSSLSARLSDLAAGRIAVRPTLSYTRDCSRCDHRLGLKYKRADYALCGLKGGNLLRAMDRIREARMVFYGYQCERTASSPLCGRWVSAVAGAMSHSGRLFGASSRRRWCSAIGVHHHCFRPSIERESRHELEVVSIAAPRQARAAVGACRPPQLRKLPAATPVRPRAQEPEIQPHHKEVNGDIGKSKLIAIHRGRLWPVKRCFDWRK